MSRYALAWTGTLALAGCLLVAACSAPPKPPKRPPPAPAAILPAATLPGIAVVPQPQRIRLAAHVYTWPARVRLDVPAGVAPEITAQLVAALRLHHVAAVLTRAGTRADVRLAKFRSRNARIGDEGYVLRIERGGVRLSANGDAGLFYGVQTLGQTIVPFAGSLRSRAVTIEDWPASGWRGVHLDVARHFFAPATIERFVDLAAHYKLNRFHWHLTDDQAWRFPVASYPALGGGSQTYSANGIREVVAYAARRYVTVVPEIDLPAHTASALRRYPFLACGGGTLCMNEAGKTFAKAVLGDVVRLFPGPYVHAGGDEVPGAARARQPAFTDALEKVLESRGKRLVGWDEILTPSLSRRAIVMVWTQRKKAADAARRGYDAVLASGPLYFDGAQGDLAQEPVGSGHLSTLEQVYSYGAVPGGTAPAIAAHLLGVQANIWTERIATEKRLFYMAFPRELALAEIAWTARERRDWNSFLGRLPDQLEYLAARRVPFRIPNAAFTFAGKGLTFAAVSGHVQSVRAWTSAPFVRLTLAAPLRGAVIRYSTDASDPRRSPRIAGGQLEVALRSSPVRIRAVVSYRGRTGAISECVVSRAAAGEAGARGTSSSWSALVSP